MGNKFCICHDSEKTGQTSVMCCNNCGLPDEDFWQPPSLSSSGETLYSESQVKELLKHQRHNCQIERDKRSYVNEAGEWFIHCEDILNAEEPPLPKPLTESNQDELSSDLKTFCDDRNYTTKPLHTVMPMILEELSSKYIIIKKKQ